MFGLPLHPLVVHFPVVLVAVLPLVAVGALWAIRRGAVMRRAWGVTVLVAAALAASSFVALETGEAQEDTVENAVPEAALHAHKEAAERFLVLSGVLLVVAGAGLARGTIGRASRIVATAGTFGLLAAGVQVGHLGAELVYRYDAPSAYVNRAPATGAEQMGEIEVPGRTDDRD